RIIARRQRCAEFLPQQIAQRQARAARQSVLEVEDEIRPQLIEILCLLNREPELSTSRDSVFDPDSRTIESVRLSALERRKRSLPYCVSITRLPISQTETMRQQIHLDVGSPAASNFVAPVDDFDVGYVRINGLLGLILCNVGQRVLQQIR